MTSSLGLTAMTSRRLASLSVLCIAAVIHVRAAEPRWTRVDAPNFVVIGATSEKRLQAIASQFEGFRDAMTTLLSPGATSTAVPTIVIAFPDEKSFAPFQPLYNGKRLDIGGQFVSRRDVNYVLLGADRGGSSLRGVFHEYSHLVLSNIAPGIPLWMNEGLAEYYSSFDLGTDGQHVVLGEPIREHLQTLSEQRWMPLHDLLTATHESPQYNEPSRRSLFYAESWALVHLMLHGVPDRRAAFSAYAADLAIGTPPDVAWAKRFRDDDISVGLRTYAERATLSSRRVALPSKIVHVSATPVALTPAAADAMFGHLLLALERPADAVPWFERASALDPKSAVAAVGGARARGTMIPSRPLDSGDWLESYMIAADLLDPNPEDATAALARTALEHTIAVRPDLANAQALYARVLEFEHRDPNRAVEALRMAHEAVPARDDYTLALAQVMAWAGDTAAAKGLLEGVIARPHLADARDQAVALMHDLEIDDAGSPGTAKRRRPVLRLVQPGEHRDEGVLENIVCTTSRVTLTVRLSDRRAIFQAATLADIQFTSYQPVVGESVTCGPRNPPDPAYVTWRPGDLDGTVVAIEFLPRKR